MLQAARQDKAAGIAGFPRRAKIYGPAGRARKPHAVMGQMRPVLRRAGTVAAFEPGSIALWMAVVSVSG